MCCTAMLFTACEKDETNGHEYVDLGLPSGTKWATMNVGATAPEEYGNYYAWGETTTKNDYSWSNYKFFSSDIDGFTKYCIDNKWGILDNKTTLEAADDVAKQKWGGNWRMPTIDEWQELIDNCTWTWTTKNGVNGYEVKATNGNSIFLPAAGYRDDDELNNAGLDGRYWSSSVDLTDDPDENARCIIFFDYDFNYFTVSIDRTCGLSVRPVYK